MEPPDGQPMRIGEIAARLDINPKTIRYYEGIGLLPTPERTPAGYRVYNAEDLERLRFVKSAQRLGLSLDEIGEVLALRDREEGPCAYVRDVLRREVAGIDRRIKELRALRDQLRALQAKADELDPAPATICRIIEHARDDDPAESRGRRIAAPAAVGLRV